MFVKQYGKEVERTTPRKFEAGASRRMSLSRERLDLVKRSEAPFPFCAHGSPHCTDLLDEPATVLGDAECWPNHLCYDSFLRQSTELWTRQTTVFAKIAQHRWSVLHPLPIGRRSLDYMRRMHCSEYLGSGYEVLLNQLPFEGKEEALWALRIERGVSTLDLFGLADYRTKLRIQRGYIVVQDGEYGSGREVLEIESDTNGDRIAVISSANGGVERVPISQLELHRREAPIHMGELAFVLKGQDASLIDSLHAAKRWWSRFKGLPLRGRPMNTGVWSSSGEFRKALREAITSLRRKKQKVTQESVSSLLNCNDRQLRRWLSHYGLTWTEARDL